MKIVFFGLGSIGKRHARLIQEYFDYSLLAYRSSRNVKKNELGIDEVYDLNDVLKWKPDVAFITNPTSEHTDCALFCAKNGINLFIEKPLAMDSEGISDLIEEVKLNNVKTYVAYCLRFHPGIVWLRDFLKQNNPIHVTVNASSYLPFWRPGTGHLERYSAQKDLGGGVILDLSHEIDYLYYLFGGIKDMKVNSKKISDVTVDSEDFADVLLEFDNGVFGNLHMNFLSRLNRREIIVDFKDKTIIIDLVVNKILIKGNMDEEINFDGNMDGVFISQLKYFFDNLNGGLMNDIYEGEKIFKDILRIKEEAGL